VNWKRPNKRSAKSRILDSPDKGGTSMWLALFMVLSVSAQDNNEAEQLFQEMEAKLDKAMALDLSFDVIESDLVNGNVL
jgi:hypothetical protein